MHDLDIRANTQGRIDLKRKIRAKCDKHFMHFAKFIPVVEQWNIIFVNAKDTGTSFSTVASALFSQCFAHENHLNFLKSLGHRPRPRVILRPFDKLDMTQGHCENWMKPMCTSFGEECMYWSKTSLKATTLGVCEARLHQ